MKNTKKVLVNFYQKKKIKINYIYFKKNDKF